MGYNKPLLAGLFVSALAGSAGAETLLFTDRNLFNTASGGDLTTIGFESAPTGGYSYVGNTYTVGGVTFKSNHMYVKDGGYLSGWFSLGTGDTLVAGYVNENTDNALVAELQPGTRAVGLDIGLEAGGSYEITFASGQVITGSLAPFAYAGNRYIREPDFVGFLSDSDIASVKFDSPLSGGWKLVDNFTTGTGVTAINLMSIPEGATVLAVPLPAAAWGGMALLGGLGLARRLGRKNEVAEVG